MARKARNANTITKVCTRTGFTITGTPDEVAEFFYRDKSQKDGFSPWSKDAERTYNKAYRAALSKAEVARKGDADDKGVVRFDNAMKRAGVRTSRAKAATPPKARKGRNTRRASAKA